MQSVLKVDIRIPQTMITGKVNNELPKAKNPKMWKRKHEKHGVHRVKKIQLHGGFIKDIWINDLAIITVFKPFKFNDVTEKVPLPSKGSKVGNNLL